MASIPTIHSKSGFRVASIVAVIVMSPVFVIHLASVVPTVMESIILSMMSLVPLVLSPAMGGVPRVFSMVIVMTVVMFSVFVVMIVFMVWPITVMMSEILIVDPVMENV